MKCSECGAAEMKVSHEDHRYVENGLPNVVLLGIEVRHCPKCDEETIVIPRIEQLDRTIAYELATQRARLSGAEVRFLRKWLGWSGQDFAKKMGVAPETVSRWENEREPMSTTAERLLRMLGISGRPVEEYDPREHIDEVARDDAPRAKRIALKVNSRGWQVEGQAA